MLIFSPARATAAPVIAALVPDHGEAGQLFRVDGTGLSTVTAGYLGLTPMSVFAQTDTYIFYTVPAGTPSSSITLVGTDGTATSQFTVDPNTAPTISPIANQTGPMNSGKTVGFTIGDIGTPAADLQIAATSSNNALIPNNSMFLTGFGGERSLSMSPTPGQFGISTIEITVTDTFNVATKASFLLTVTPVDSGDMTITGFNPASGTVTSLVTITGAHLDDPANIVTPYFKTYNGDWVAAPTAFAVLGDLHVAVPANARTGPITIVKDVPSRNPLLRTIVTSTMDFTVNAFIHHFSPTEGGLGQVVDVVGAGLANATAFYFNGLAAPIISKNENQVTAQVPIGAASGPITIVTSDAGTAISPTTFVSSAPNTPPTIEDIPDATVNEDEVAAINFTIGDLGTPAAQLTLHTSSDNTALVEHASIVFSETGANRKVTITPKPNQFGSANITIDVNDGNDTTSTTFKLTVNPVNDTPTISAIADRTVARNISTGAIPFIVGDVETAAASLNVSGTSSNTALVSDSSIVFGGSGLNRTVSVTPVAGQLGTSTITITVSDGVKSSIETFILTVVADSTAPVVAVTAPANNGYFR